MDKNKWIIALFIIQILSFLIIPFFLPFWIIPLIITLFISLFVVLISDDWFKYFYPVFAMSCYIVIMRVFWLTDFLEIKELFFVCSWIGSAIWCILLALKLVFQKS